MIELKVADYCHGCPDFEPYARMDAMSTALYANGVMVEQRTDVKCQNAKRCDAIYRFIRKQVDVKPEIINEALYWFEEDHHELMELEYIAKKDFFQYKIGKARLSEPEKRLGESVRSALRTTSPGSTVYVRNDVLRISYKITVISE